MSAGKIRMTARLLGDVGQLSGCCPVTVVVYCRRLAQAVSEV
ncbi:hypothetical protein [Dickeya undicola]|nr:hypothetical protein [Dickeya undicola]